MAGLFVYVFIQDRNKNTRLLEDNSKMLQALSQSNETLSRSNDNIAKSLDLIQVNLTKINDKVDRNYCNVLLDKRNSEK